MARKTLEQVATVIMWLVIAAGIAVIFLDAWLRIDARYASEGIVTEGLMLIIMGGIPSVAFAGVVSIAFRFLLGSSPMATPPNNEASEKQKAAPSGGHDFIE